ncbi:DUF748 domain-containing protein [Vibrio sp. SS-MA-C1-2]|uniref:DUF748 domain-containing protein n=1 Tax=Vibrio sp. SS-MA-C1-2 TaxID=2908646 RepID=UPI001F317D77|nr:DUF748 domain-containing protein [Vibrio sp. SS-MA-C1-2]UJF17885.1 DUF748 domain-containing protein [Vibrio sp. SS-MA-C1-2]
MSSTSNASTGFLAKYKQLAIYQRIFAILLFVYLLFVFILGIVIPQSVEKYLPQELSKVVGRHVELDSFKINPFTLEVTINNFSIAEKDGEPFAGLKALQFEYQFWDSIYNLAFSVKDIKLVTPSVHIERLNDASGLLFNFSDIISKLTTEKRQPVTEPENKSNEIPHFIISNFSIYHANISFVDQLTNSHVHYPKLGLKIPYFDSHYTLQSKVKNIDVETEITHLTRSNDYDINILGRQGGQIQASGKIQLTPLNIIGDVNLSNIQLPQFWDFISAQFKAKLISGRLGLSANYQVTLIDNQLDLNVEKGSVSLSNINFNYQEKPLVNLSYAGLDDIEINLNEQQVSIHSLNTYGLVVNTTIDKKSVDIATAFQPISMVQNEINQQSNTGDDSPETSEELDPTTAWNITLSGIDLSDYQLNMTEKLFKETNFWSLHDISLTTGEINSALTKPIDYQFKIGINQTGKIIAKGKVDVAEEQLNTALTIKNFALNDLQNYLSDYVNIDVKQGEFNLQGDINSDFNAKQLTFNGALSVTDLDIIDKAHEKDLLKWQTLNINNIRFSQIDNQLNIEQLKIMKPYARMIIAEDQSTNIGDLVVNQHRQGTEGEKQDVANPTSDLHRHSNESSQNQTLLVSIKEINFIDGSAFFADNSLRPNFGASIELINGNITGFSSQMVEPAKVNMTGKIDRYAPVNLNGEINPFLEKPFIDLDFNFKDVELTSINPYSGTYAGYYIDKGLVSIDLNYQLDNNQLVGSNHVVIDQLTLGKPSNSDLATSLPVSLAIALLQDSDGVIDLGVGVSGDIDDPSFSVGGIIIKALGNIITKAVTSPFSMLAGLIDSDSDELNQVDFYAGSARLSVEAKRNLEKLAIGLEQRPKLILDIEGSIDPHKDREALRDNKFKAKLAKESQITISQLPKSLSASQFPTTGQLTDALERLYERENGQDLALLKEQVIAENQDEVLTPQQVTERAVMTMYNLVWNEQLIAESELVELAKLRATAVKVYLIEQEKLASNRVFLLDNRVDLHTDGRKAVLTLDAK